MARFIASCLLMGWALPVNTTSNSMTSVEIFFISYYISGLCTSTYLGEGLLNIGQDVADILNAYRETNEVRGDTSFA